jgi:hypothetical protein
MYVDNSRKRLLWCSTVPRQYMLAGLGVCGRHSRLMEVHSIYRFFGGGPGCRGEAAAQVVLSFRGGRESQDSPASGHNVTVLYGVSNMERRRVLGNESEYCGWNARRDFELENVPCDAMQT